jgi:NhaC family Na+:H+ antiporter
LPQPESEEEISSQPGRQEKKEVFIMTNKTEIQTKIKVPSLLDALIPIISLVVMLASAVFLYGTDATGGPIQVALLLSGIVAMLIGVKNGHSIERLGKAAVDGISTAIGAIFILLAVGALIGTWSMSGTIATLTYYGIKVISPTWFYAASLIICGIIALATGSAWTVAATLGVGLIGIAEVIGVSPVITAGAVISGTYFGDQISPLSETTNLAPAVTGTDLITHIKNMLPTTVPSIVLALILFAVFGFRGEVSTVIDLQAALDALSSVFYISLWTLLPLLVVMVMAFRRMPPTTSIMAGALLGGLIAVLLQPDVVLAFVGDPSLSTPWAMIKGVWSAMATGFEINSGIEFIDEMVSRGGMIGMLETILLIFTAMAFGGIMEYTGMLARLVQPIVQRAKSDKSMMLAAGLTAIGVNIVAADQYMAIVLTGNIYKKEFEDRGISPESLARQIEDTATVTSPLIPWNSCGAYMAATLGIATMAYLPYCFFNLLNVAISFIYDLIGFQIKHIKPGEEYEETPDEVRFHGVAGQRTDTITHEEARPV